MKQIIIAIQQETKLNNIIEYSVIYIIIFVLVSNEYVGNYNIYKFTYVYYIIYIITIWLK